MGASEAEEVQWPLRRVAGAATRLRGCGAGAVRGRRRRPAVELVRAGFLCRANVYRDGQGVLVNRDLNSVRPRLRSIEDDRERRTLRAPDLWSCRVEDHRLSPPDPRLVESAVRSKC